MGKLVTDPDLIAQLEALSSTPKSKKVTDPKIIEQLEKSLAEDGVDFSTSEMIKNIPSSAKQFASDIVQPILNPIDTAKSLGSLTLGVADKIDKGVASFLPKEYVEWGNKANNYLVDLTGAPDSWRLPEKAENMKWENQKYADAAGQFYKDRYGSIDNAKKTIMSDPVGSLSDAALGLTGVGAVVPGAQRVQKIGQAIEPVNLAINTAKTGAATLTPKSLPANLYERAAKWSTTLPPQERTKLTQTALDHKIMPNSAGVGRASVLIDDLGKQIDGLIQTADKTGARVPVEAVLKNLKELRGEVGGFNLGASNKLKRIDDVAKQFMQDMKKQGRKTVSVDELQRFKQNIYKETNFNTKQQNANYIDSQIEQSIARAAKEKLEEMIPGIKELNAQQGDLLNLQPHLVRTSNRVGNRNPISMDTPMHIGAGGVIGDVPGAAVGAGVALSSWPRAQAATGLKLHELQSLGLMNMLQNSGFGAGTNMGLLQLERIDEALNP